MNRKNSVKGTGLRIPGFENTILDGEYITVDKTENLVFWCSTYIL